MKRLIPIVLMLMLVLVVTLTGCGGATIPSLDGGGNNDGSNDGDGADTHKYFAYVTNTGSTNITVYSINAVTGELTEISGSPFATGSYPNSIAIDPTGKFAYVVNKNSNSVTAYSINADGSLTPINTDITNSSYPTGTYPSFGIVDPTGKFIYVTNTTSDNITAFSIDPVTGALESIGGSPFATSRDPNTVTIDRNSKFAYAANLLSNSISIFSIGTTGALSNKSDVSISVEGTQSPYPTSITITPDGKFAYVPLQGSTKIVAYAIDAANGGLTEISGSPFTIGSASCSIAIDPTGKYAYVANLNTDDVTGYSIHVTTGALTPVSGGPFTAGNMPEDIAIDPTGKFVYVTNYYTNNVMAYSIDAVSGALKVIGTSFATGKGPSRIVIVKK